MWQLSDATRLAASVQLAQTNGCVGDRTVTARTIDEASEHRVIGLLWRALELGHVRADEEHTIAAREQHLAAMRTCLLAEESAVLAVRCLTAAGVECRVLKGVASSHLDYADPSDRAFGDADLLIRRRDHAVALGALAAAGFVRDGPPVRGWWERRFGKAIVHSAPSGGEVDLHLGIIGGYFGFRIDHDAMWQRSPSGFELGGTPVLALCPEDRLLHACCHAVLGGNSGLRAVRDVAQLILVSEAPWRSAADRAVADGYEAVLASAIRSAWTELQLAPDHPAVHWARAHRASGQQQQALASYQQAFTSTWAAEARGVLPALGAADRALFLVGLATPSIASLRSRGRSPVQHLQRLARGLVSRS